MATSAQRAKKTAARIDVAKRLGLHPYTLDRTDLEEGVHYDVVAYTDWADVFVPTVVQWNHGEMDHLRSYGEAVANAQRALHHGEQDA